MDIEPYNYLDYNRTIVAFHGTTEAVADRLVDGDAFARAVTRMIGWEGASTSGKRSEAGMVVDEDVQEESETGRGSGDHPAWELLRPARSGRMCSRSSGYTMV